MDFGLSETQEMVRNSAREFLEARESIALARRAHSDLSASQVLWDEVSGLGWPGLAIPEKYGGSGLGFDDLCVLLEECAAGLMPGPLFETTVLGASLLTGCGNETVKLALLPRIADGDAIVTLAHLEAAGRWDDPIATTVESRGEGWRLSGKKRFVPAGAIASDLVVSARSPAGELLLLGTRTDASGVEVEPVKVVSGEPYATVRLTQVALQEADLIARSEDAQSLIVRTMHRAAVARASQMAAVADTVVKQTVDYISARKQFGRPIGSFQALQHRLADMATMARSARHLARSATWQISNERPDQVAVARAKSFASEHMPQVCWDAHQLHGAIGFTWEHDLHLYTRRVLSWRAEYGDARYWRRAAAGTLIGT